MFKTGMIVDGEVIFIDEEGGDAMLDEPED